MDLKSETGTLSGKNPLSISFSGSGFLAVYQLGVAQCLIDKAPGVVQGAPKIFGSSAGSLVAAAVVCGSNLDLVRDDIVTFVKLMEDYVLGPLHPSVNVFKSIECAARRRLPENAHLLASGRLHISMTRIPDCKNVIVSEFQSREDVVQALLCSCYIPIYCGLKPPFYKGARYIDGGFTNMQPITESYQTLTVSPFSWSSDICPFELPSEAYAVVMSGIVFHLTANNRTRIMNALYPRSGMVLKEEFQRGYEDAFFFLKNSDLIEFQRLKASGLLVHQKEKKYREDKEINGKSVVPPSKESSDGPEEQDQRPTGLLSYLSTLEQTWKSSLPVWLQAGIRALKTSLLPWLEAMLLSNLLAQVGMIDRTYLYMRLISYVLLPYTLPIYVFFAITYRFLLWLRHNLDMVFWQDMKQFSLFFVNLMVSTARPKLVGWGMITPELQNYEDKPRGRIILWNKRGRTPA